MEDRTSENLKMLDEIDFEQFFDKEKNTNLRDLRYKVDEFYTGTEFVENDVMEGDVFNWIDNWELGEYLAKRYPKFRCYEVTEHYYYIDD